MVSCCICELFRITCFHCESTRCHYVILGLCVVQLRFCVPLRPLYFCRGHKVTLTCRLQIFIHAVIYRLSEQSTFLARTEMQYLKRRRYFYRRIEFLCVWQGEGRTFSSSFFLCLFSPFPGHGLTSFLSPITAMPCCCMPVFGIEKSFGIFPHFGFPSIPTLSGRPSSETSFQNSFRDSVDKHSYYMPSPL